MNRITMAGRAAAIAVAAAAGFPGTAMSHSLHPSPFVDDLAPLRPVLRTCYIVRSDTGEVARVPCELPV